MPNTIKPLAVSIGEPAGIGPEIILKAWLKRSERGLPSFAVLGDSAHLDQLAKRLNLPATAKPCDAEQVTDIFSNAIPVIELSSRAKANPGQSHRDDGTLVVEAITRSVELVKSGTFSGLVTAPINKKALYDCGFDFPGHTEYLAHLSTELYRTDVHPVMMLAGPELRTIPVTIHIPLAEVATQLSHELIVKVAKIAHRDLNTRFGIASPRLAIAGLNPHAGEDGAMGSEDANVISPAVNELQQMGIDAIGPLPADTMFHNSARQTYDVALCMFHDQALIPAKTLAFDDAVNVTLGLPFIRTSPDHGTAFDIAGKGIANPASFIAALKMAEAMTQSQAVIS